MALAPPVVQPHLGPAHHQWDCEGMSSASRELIAKLRQARERSEQVRADAAAVSRALQRGRSSPTSPRVVPYTSGDSYLRPGAASLPHFSAAVASGTSSPAVPCYQMPAHAVAGGRSSPPVPRPRGDGNAVTQVESSIHSPPVPPLSVEGSCPVRPPLPQKWKSAPQCLPGKDAGVPVRENRRVIQEFVRVRLGSLDFEPASGGFSAPAFLETSGLRVLLQTGQEVPVKWEDAAPVTQNRRAMRFGRAVSEDGRYSVRVNCDFDEEVDVPFPSGLTPTHIAIDVWLERRTVAERLDGALMYVGMGTGLPEYDRTWLGRVVKVLPQKGNDTRLEVSPVIANQNFEGHVPKVFAVGIEWIAEELEEENKSSEDLSSELQGWQDPNELDKADSPCTVKGDNKCRLFGFWSGSACC